MDLYQLRYFLAITETGSFSKAAERLFVSQPSLSAGIKKLEQVLDVTLFERGGRRAVLTPAGKLFQKKAKILLDNYQATLRELRELKQQPVLRLGTLRTIRIACLADLIHTFQQQSPSVLIELVDGSFSELGDQLEQGDVDLVMTVLDGYEAPKTSLTLFQQRRVLAVSTNHPLASRETVQLADLHRQPFIERLHCERYREMQKLFTSIRPQIVYRADHEEWVFSLVAAGLGLSIMPEWSNVPGVVFIPIADLPLQRTVGLVWRRGYESEVVTQFLTCVGTHDWGNLFFSR
ncbi:LysR family transcriptional regulator [Floridanema evergladense]|uniref:LysR family transcriptional regulator n=1 Tax=Floridaenema evergladense BLCC-F167 TaxID=3153639 RepID=A0ABV4WUE7_9CYAN